MRSQELDQILSELCQGSSGISIQERKYLLKAKKRLEKNDFFQSIVDQLDVILQSLSYLQENGLADGVRQLYEKLNADRPKISEKANRLLAANSMAENTLSADQAIIEEKGFFQSLFPRPEPTGWEKLQLERAQIFQDSGLSSLFIFVDDQNRLLRFQKPMGFGTYGYLSDNTWHYMPFLKSFPIS